MSLKGNRGELSELYAFYKLLAEGKIYSADENLVKTADFVEVRAIKRQDDKIDLQFEIDTGKIFIKNSKSNKVLLSFSQLAAKTLSQKIVQDINSGSKLGAITQKEILSHKITQVKQKSSRKGDIEIIIYDPIHGISSEQEFSIKSFLGSKPTLFNANQTTNIIYQVKDAKGHSLQLAEIERINSISSGHKYIKRIKDILDSGYSINFHSYSDEIFKLNLEIIDSSLPEIMAEIVLAKYRDKVTKIIDVINYLRNVNPMGYDLSKGHKFYEYRIVNFLVEAALGMTSKTPWSGEFQVVGGILIIKPNAELLCYHLIDFNKFKKYLKNSSRLDNPSGSKMGYGNVYQEKGETFIKLNFQVKA